MNEVSLAEATEKLAVARTSVAHARTVLAQGTPEFVEAVEMGEVAVSAGKDWAHLRVGVAGTSIF